MSIERRRIPLAWKNLTEKPWRLAASVAGTAFAVVLMLVQDGFRSALLDNMVAVIAHLEGDLFITLKTRYMFSEPMRFPRQRLDLARGAAGIERASPLHVEVDTSRWRNTLSGITRRIRVLAFQPGDDLLDLPAVRAQRDAWDRPDAALADDRSKLDLYGPLKTGTTSEFMGKRVRIVGDFALGTDFRSSGTILMSEANYLRYFPERAGSSWGETAIDVGVLRLVPGADPEAARAALAARLTPDVMVLSKAELMEKERKFWENATPVGIVFDIGVFMGFIVGLAICYQVLFSEVSDRLAEFATLKAMGYTNRTLMRMVVEEGVYLAVLGYAAGLGVSVVLFRWLQNETGLSMRLKPLNLAVILGLTVVMCVISGALAARKVTRLDPADLYG